MTQEPVTGDLDRASGDVIACGTSLGARPIRPDQEISVTIDGIGSVTITTKGPDA